MNVVKEAHGALPPVWDAMIALAEAGNDIVVLDHRHAESDAARQIAAIASDLAALSYAAEVLARLQTRT